MSVVNVCTLVVAFPYTSHLFIKLVTHTRAEVIMLTISCFIICIQNFLYVILHYAAVSMHYSQNYYS